jgi:hypothetical protein
VNAVATEDKDKQIERLETTLTLKKKNGSIVTVSTVCGSWKYMQKFLSDFENTLLKGNNGKAKHQSKTEP